MAITVTGTQAMENGVTVTYDKNYFEDDLFTDQIITMKYGNNFGGYKLKEIIDNENAKYGKEIKFTMNETASTYGYGPYGGADIYSLEKDKTYTWSMYIKSNSTRTIRIGKTDIGMIEATINDEWQRFTYTFVANNSTCNFAFYNRYTGWNDGDTLEIHSLELMEGEPTYYTTTIEKNSNLGTTITPKRTGYEFLGWYTDPVAGERVTSNTTITQDTTLYAHWRFIE